MNGLNISPKTSPNNSGSSPASSTSPTYKGSPNPAGSAFLPRTQAQLTFTTATFAQTKFGSTKLKTNSKRNNRWVFILYLICVFYVCCITFHYITDNTDWKLVFREKRAFMRKRKLFLYFAEKL